MRELRSILNDTTDRVWRYDIKLRSVQAGVAALAENGVWEPKTDLTIYTKENQFYYPLPREVEPEMVFAVYLPTSASADPYAPIANWHVEPRGTTVFLALDRAYPESRQLRVEYLAPYAVPPVVTTLVSAFSAFSTSMAVGYMGDWPASGFVELWPVGETHVGEVIYYASVDYTNAYIGNFQQSIEGPRRPRNFAAGTTIGPALDLGAEMKSLILLYAEAECWRYRQNQSSRSQYLQNYANLEIKARRQFNDRIRTLRTRFPARMQAPRQPRYGGAGRAPNTVREYFQGR